jgi:adenylate cyclase
MFSKKLIWALFLVVLSVAAGYYVHMNPGFRRWEDSSIDFFFSLRASLGKEEAMEAAVLLVDEKSLEERYQYYDPIPRRYLASLIDSLRSRDVRVIALDVALLKPLTKLDPQADSLLAQSIIRAGNVVGISLVDVDDSGKLTLRRPHPLVGSALIGVGHAGLDATSGKGGFPTVRSFRPFVRSSDGKNEPSFSAMVYCTYSGKSIDQVLQEGMIDVPVASEQNQEFDQSILINFVGPPPVWKKYPDGAWIQAKSGAIATFKSINVTGERLLPHDILKGKAVFVGLLSEFSLDQFGTPYYGPLYSYQPMRGAEVHANAFLTLLHGNSVQRLDQLWVIFCFVLLSVFVVLATLRLDFWQEVAAVLASLLMIWGTGFVLFTLKNIWLPAVAMTVTVLFAYVSTSVQQALTERKRSRKITGIFSQYVDKRVVRQLVENPKMVKLDGEMRDVTLLFSDLKGFTGISEQLGPERIVKVMNLYLNEMSEVIQNNRGTIDKFIGDAIMAFWGAPIPDEDAAYLACLSALQMKRKLGEITPQIRMLGGIELRHRIGINSGNCIIGNIGSVHKVNYTAIGDSVNLASRLEGVNKRYGTSIIISESTYSRVSGRMQAREIERVLIDGRKEPVKIFELMEIGKKVIDANLRNFLEFYNLGLASYKNQDWDEASAYFVHAQKFVPDDPVCRFFIARVELLKNNPPGHGWDGVFKMKV